MEMCAGPNGSCAPTWNPEAVYQAGHPVTLNGENFEAAYWTQNQNPATNNGRIGTGQPWIPVGVCTQPFSPKTCNAS